MRLYEYEAKELLRGHGVPVPEGEVLSDVSVVKAPCVVKAQVLFGKRADLGGIKVCETEAEASAAIKSMLGSEIKGVQVSKVLVEELVDISKEYYVAFLFDTDERAPVLLFSEQGGTGVEEKAELKKLVIDELAGLSEDEATAFLSEENKSLAPVLVRLWNVFVKEDCRLLEINPLVKTADKIVCIDARVDVDDFALKRHKERSFPPRPSTLGRQLTEREKTVKEASEADHRGTVKYIELDGDIAVLAAGGGGSLTCMDALIDAGGKPANYSEFSGNPSDEKMYVLAKQALSKPGLKGCWIVGAIANFSRVDAMMAGIVKAFEELQPEVPVVVRRAGPFEKEGLQLLREAAKKNNWPVDVFGAETPLTATAKMVVEKAYGDSA